MRKILFNIALLGCIPLFATAKGNYDVKKHQFNQEIIKSIMNEYSSDTLSVDCIEEIGKKALQRGLDVSAYFPPSLKGNAKGSLTYASIPLWEGGDIPYTLYVYIWPSKQVERESQLEEQVKRESCIYSSTIHSHPFPFAFYVLEGTMIQYLYEKVGGRVVKCVLKEVYPSECFFTDNHEDVFIHRLACKHPYTSPAYTLHLFNIGNDDEYQEVTELMQEEMEYQKVLKKDGSIHIRKH